MTAIQCSSSYCHGVRLFLESDALYGFDSVSSTVIEPVSDFSESCSCVLASLRILSTTNLLNISSTSERMKLIVMA